MRCVKGPLSESLFIYSQLQLGLYFSLSDSRSDRGCCLPFGFVVHVLALGAEQLLSPRLGLCLD